MFGAVFGYGLPFFAQENCFVVAIFPVLIYIGRLVDDVDNTSMMMTEVGCVHAFVGTTTEEIVELYSRSASRKPGDSSRQTGCMIGISIRLQKIRVAAKRILETTDQTIR